jgi:hypothetical protein
MDETRSAAARVAGRLRRCLHDHAGHPPWQSGSANGALHEIAATAAREISRLRLPTSDCTDRSVTADETRRRLPHRDARTIFDPLPNSAREVPA